MTRHCNTLIDRRIDLTCSIRSFIKTVSFKPSSISQPTGYIPTYLLNLFAFFLSPYKWQMTETHVLLLCCVCLACHKCIVTALQNVYRRRGDCSTRLSIESLWENYTLSFGLRDLAISVISQYCMTWHCTIYNMSVKWFIDTADKISSLIYKISSWF